MSALGNPSLNIGISVSNFGKEFIFSDTTGTYNSITNPTGYGTPNINSNSVTTATIGVLQFNQTIPYLFTFTISSGTISAATLTAPDGTITDIFADLTSTAFPFISGTNPFIITNVYLGFPIDKMITDMVWTFNYEIIGSYVNSSVTYDFDLNTSSDILVYCNTECCVKKMFVNLGCGCCDEKLDAALRADAMLKTAKYSAEVGQYCAAQNSINKAQELCHSCNCSC